MSEKQSVVMKLNVPFCTKKPSFVGRELIETGNTDVVHHYILALARELAANADEFGDCRVEAIRIGGGTASIMNGNDFDQLCRLIRDRYDVTFAFCEKGNTGAEIVRLLGGDVDGKNT